MGGTATRRFHLSRTLNGEKEPASWRAGRGHSLWREGASVHTADEKTRTTTRMAFLAVAGATCPH